MTQPSDQRTLDDQAVVLHELYQSLQRAGFDQSEAIALCGWVLVGRDGALNMVRRLLDGRPDSPGASPPGA